MTATGKQPASRTRAHRAAALEIFRDQSSHGAVQPIAYAGQVVQRRRVVHEKNQISQRPRRDGEHHQAGCGYRTLPTFLSAGQPDNGAKSTSIFLSSPARSTRSIRLLSVPPYHRDVAGDLLACRVLWNQRGDRAASR
jgi:hypothetical protein